ncbi:MAG: hypothetical protein JW838_13450 [Spirochaetes bacterium]|nr:hypothetical protein [Spirochaetota bacterium]
MRSSRDSATREDGTPGREGRRHRAWSGDDPRGCDVDGSGRLMKGSCLFAFSLCVLISTAAAAKFHGGEAAGGDLSFRVHYSGMVYSDLDSPLGASLFVDFYTHSFLSFGLANYFHVSRNYRKAFKRYQVVNAVYGRFYFKPFFLRSPVFKMGPNIGVGIVHEWQDIENPLRSPDLFAGIGMVIQVTRHVGITGAMQLHSLALDRLRLQVISNIGVSVNFPVRSASRAGFRDSSPGGMSGEGVPALRP